jgi:hypothetical protein
VVQLVGAGPFASVIINLVKIFVVIAHPRCYDASSPCYNVPIPHIVVLVLEALLVLILEVFVHLFITFSVIKMVAKTPRMSNTSGRLGISICSLMVLCCVCIMFYSRNSSQQNAVFSIHVPELKKSVL